MIHKKDIGISIVATIFLLVATVAYFWIVLYTTGKKVDAQDLDNKNKVEMLMLDTSHKQKMFLRGIEDKIMEIDTYILKKAKVASFLRDIETLSAYTGTTIHIENIAVEEIVDNKRKKVRQQRGREQDTVKNALNNVIITFH